MSRTWAILIPALAVLAVAWFLLRDRLGVHDAADAAGRQQDEAPSALGSAPGSEGAGGDSGDPARRATLFGRAHVRIGVGEIVGRLRDAITKEPVAGATVYVAGNGYGGEAIDATIASGEDGRFRLEAVPAGDDVALAIDRQGRNERALVGLVVTADRTLDLGTIWLGEAGTLAGRVVEMDGEGLAGAEVRVLRTRFSEQEMLEDFVGFISTLDREPAPVARGTSGPSGRFRIEGVPPGPVTVIVRMPGRHQAVRTVAMTENGATGGPVELRLSKAEPLVGRVVTEEGLGFAGAHVGFLPQGPSDDGHVERQFVETAADGSFRIEAPPPTRELVAIVAAEGYPTQFVQVGSDRSELLFTLVGGARIVLRFVHADDGGPIPDAAILVLLTETVSAGGMGTFLTGVTDAAGRIELHGRPGVVSMVLLQHAELGSSTYGPDIGGEGKGVVLEGPATIEIRAGDNEVELRRPRGVIVRGTVTDAAGRPVAGAAVTSVAGSFWYGRGGKARTDASGAYRLATPGAAPLRVRVEAPGYAQDPETREVQLVAGAVELEHDVTMLRAVRVEGVVVGREDKPVPGAQVRLRAADPDDTVPPPEPTVTDTHGRFVLDDVAPSDRYSLVGRAAGYAVSHTNWFRVPKGAGMVRAPTLELVPGAAVVVEVRDVYGEAVAGAYVEVRLEPREELYWDAGRRWRPWAELVTTASGRVDARDLPDGRVTFTARKEGSAASRRSVALSAKAPPSEPVVLRLRPAVTLRGSVVDQHGDTVAPGTVSVGRIFDAGASEQDEETWIPYQAVRTDRRGRFEIRDVPSGIPVTLRFEAEGYRSRTLETEGRPDDVRLEVHRIDPAVHRRMEALRAEQYALYDQLGATEDAAAKKELLDRIQAIQQELHDLDVAEGAPAQAEAARGR